MKFENMSYGLQVLLLRVKDAQVSLNGFYDPRGYYAEYDSDNCKPYSLETILEAQLCPWLIFHKDSDKAYELDEPTVEIYEDDDGNEYEEVEESFCSGVSFITIKESYLESISDE